MQNSQLIDIHDNHFYLDSCQDIDDILSPLKKFKIHLFSFLRNYADGSQIYLSNNQQWIKDYYKYNLFQTSLFEQHPKQYQTGFIAWPAESNLEVFLHGKNYYNSHYGVTYCDKYLDFCDFYFFSGANTSYLQNLFLNNKEIIHHFILYYKDRAHDLINKASRHKIVIPSARNYSVSNRKENEILIMPNFEQLKTEFYSESKIHNCYFQNNDEIKKIPPRQLQFIIQFLNHKSIPEIAQIMNISIRTAESYFNNIKLKFNCTNKADLLEKFKKSGLRLEYF